MTYVRWTALGVLVTLTILCSSPSAEARSYAVSQCNGSTGYSDFRYQDNTGG